MSFLQPAWLLLELLAVAIIALHLRRRRRLVVPSTFVWERVAGMRPTTARRRLPLTTLPLILQLLLLTLLVVSLARPVLGARAAGPWIVVVDASGSMQATDVGGSRLDAAKAYLRSELARRADGGAFGHPISIVAVGARATVVGAQLSSLKAAQAAVEAVRPTAAMVRWQGLERVLPGLQPSGKAATVTVLTDPSDAAAGRAAVSRALAGATVTSVTFAGKHPNNVGLTTVSAHPMTGGAWRIRGTVRRFAGKSTKTVVTVYFRGTGGVDALPYATVPVQFGPDGTGPFDTQVTLPGSGTVEVGLPPDDLAADNRAYLQVRSSARTVRVLEVGPGDAALERALTSIDSVKVYRAPSLPASVSGYDLVIVDGVHVGRRPEAATWWLNSAPPGISVGPVLEGPKATFWRSDHPLSQAVAWSSIRIDRAEAVPVLPGATVLLAGGGHPLVQARTVPQGRQVLTAFAVGDSNWSRQTSFPSFVFDLIRWVAPDVGRRVAPSCRVGVSCRLRPDWLGSRTTLIDPAGVGTPLPDPWVGAGGTGGTAPARWLAPWADSLFEPAQPGLYTIVDGSSRHQATVNAFGSKASALAAGGAPATGGPRELLPFWRWLLVAALVVLLAEAWAASRLPRRRDARASGWRALSRAPLTWRALVMALVVLAFLDPPLPWPEHHQQTVLITDGPDLYPASAAATLRQFTRSAQRQSSPTKQLGIVTIGMPSTIGFSSSSSSSSMPSGKPGAPSQPWAGADLGGALRLAAGMLAWDQTGRVVVAADEGTSTRELGPVLARLRARGVPVDVLAVHSARPGDAVVTRVEVPPAVYPMDPFTLHALIQSPVRQRATVRLFEDGASTSTRSVTLVPGSNDVSFHARAATRGRHQFSVSIRAEQDSFAANDRAGLSVEVRPRPKVAIVTNEPVQGKALATALAKEGVDSKLVQPANAPWSVKGWLAYDACILMDVPAIDLHSTQQEQLETWVRDDGGGLIIMGGANSFGPGGYFHTPLERLSPLSSKIPRRAPQVAMLFVLDRSGSMQQSVGNVSRLAIAKRATLDAVKLLNPASLTGVVVFDTKATVVVRLQPIGDVSNLRKALEGVQAAGGTALYPALVQAFHQLSGVRSMAKHVVVMSDGLSQPGDFAGILARMRAANITVSAVAIGDGADTGQLERVAALGKGAFHSATDIKALPSILAQEALLLSASPVKNKRITPKWGDRSASFLTGLPDTLPALQGYVETTAKPMANVALRGADGTPLLASWRYGVGRVIAFASQGAGPWTAAWLKASSYGKLWAQALRWTLSSAPRPGIDVEVGRSGDWGVVNARGVLPDGTAATGWELAAHVTTPSKQTLSMPLAEVAPGTYRARFPTSGAGTYRVQVSAATPQANPSASGNGSPPPPASSGLFVGFPARYAADASRTAALRTLAGATGGRVLDSAASVFPGRTPWHWQARVRPRWWLVLALAAFLVELGLRYGAFAPWRSPRRAEPRTRSTDVGARSG